MAPDYEGPVIYRIKPNSCPFITGLAPSYSLDYDEDILLPYIEEERFEESIQSINDQLFTYWPCDLCYFGCGLVLGILTWGLTWLLPYQCIKDAHENVIEKIKRQNAKTWNKRGLHIKLNLKFFWRSSIDVMKIVDETEPGTEIVGINSEEDEDRDIEIGNGNVML